MSPTTRARLPLTAGLAAALLLAGCGTGSDDETDPPAEASTSGDGAASEGASDGQGDETASGGESASGESPSDGAADAVDPADHVTNPELLDHVEWVLALLEPGAEDPEAAEVEERMSDEMLAQVPAEQFATLFAQLRAGGPYTVTAAVQTDSTQPRADVRLQAEAGDLLMNAVLGDDGRLAGLSFVPDTSGEPPELSGWGDLDTALEELGGESQVVVGSVADGQCTIEHTTDGVTEGGEPAPSGSVFKLIVLSAVADAVEAGDLAWDDDLAITDELRSLPSGILQEREAGSTVTVQEAAELMISISDNTATDLLLDAVGQDAIAGAAEAAGLDTSRVLPVASTRQFFQLGWQADDALREQWAAAGTPEERQAVLDQLPAELDLEPGAVTEPRWPGGVGWMLTGEDVCSTFARLQEQAGEEAGEPVRDILSANPGVAVPEGASYQGFKGGSAPGVLAFSFYVESGSDEEGDGQVLIVQTRSEEQIDQLRATTIIGAGVELLAQE
ncbi:MAG: serine hydrolase [Actinomycetaceae bacterium]